MFQASKPKSAGKVMVPPSVGLENEVIETLENIALLVGATLGPGGKQVLIERPEMNMKPIVTKDGVTVIKHLGYHSAVKQLILESARDAAIRTASEAGDGTTSATILSSSIARSTADVVKEYPKLSPQKIVREMQALVPHLMEKIKSYSIDAQDEETLLKVATLSANGDVELAKAIIEAFNVVGEEGNITIIEINGPSKYEIQKIHGYTVEKGYEDSCRNFSNGFINDRSGTMVVLNNPLVLLFDGVINDIGQVYDGLQKLSSYVESINRHDSGVVLVAHGFSDTVLGDLHVNWQHPKTVLKVVPLLTPENALRQSKTNFLYDLQAYTGSPVFNPIDRPIVDLDPELLYKNSRTNFFEGGRFRSSIMAQEDVDAVQIRVDELKLQLKKPESAYEANDLNVRIGKLTSGVARFNIYGVSTGETREKRDRAEDAWMAIRGAIKHGACPGGGSVLVKLGADLTVLADKETKIAKKMAMLVLAEALLKPVRVLYSNYGYTKTEVEQQIIELLKRENETFDISEQKWVPSIELLDSVPAITEAIRNSISIASLLGSLGGIVAFARDSEEDRKEADFVRKFQAATGERGSIG
jgi:chaperonin GroEL